jgi:capsular polysaccharide biosynthesis protein
MEEQSIELREYFQIIKKRIWIIVLITSIATITSGIISYFFITPTYEASTQLLVNKSQEKNQVMVPDFNDIQSSLKLVDTYNVIINSPRILDKTISDMGLKLTTKQLSDKIKVSAVQNSQVMSITVDDPSPQMAVGIANGLAQTFNQEIKGIMQVDNVQILAEAKVSDASIPVKPKKLLNMAIAFVVGLMTSVGIAFLLEYLDNTIKTEQDVERILGLSVLGGIAQIDHKLEAAESDSRSVTLGGQHFEA